MKHSHRKYIVSGLLFVFGGLIGYIGHALQGSSSAKLFDQSGGYYHVETLQDPLSWYHIENFVMSFFYPYYQRFSRQSDTNLFYCKALDGALEDEQMIGTGAGYVLFRDKIYLEGKYISTCDDVPCEIDKENPDVLYHGDEVFVKGVVQTTSE